MLERYLFRNPWTLGLPALGAAAFLTADTCNLLLSDELAPPGVLEPRTAPEVAANLAPGVDTRALLDRNLFGALRQEGEGPQAGLEPRPPVPEEACPHTALALDLLATFVRPQYVESTAILRIGDRSRAREIRVGSLIEPGAEVTRIERGQVYLRIEDRCESIGLDGAAAPSVPREVRSTPDRARVEVRKVGPTDYSIPREHVQRALSDLPHIGRQVRIVPHFQGKTTVGYKVFAIRPASLFDRLGLENGDVLRRVNGYTLDDPRRFLEIYTKLEKAPRLTVDLERKGRRMTLNYDLAGSPL